MVYRNVNRFQHTAPLFFLNRTQTLYKQRQNKLNRLRPTAEPNKNKRQLYTPLPTDFDFLFYSVSDGVAIIILSCIFFHLDNVYRNSFNVFPSIVSNVDKVARLDQSTFFSSGMVGLYCRRELLSKQ